MEIEGATVSCTSGPGVRSPTCQTEVEMSDLLRYEDNLVACYEAEYLLSVRLQEDKLDTGRSVTNCNGMDYLDTSEVLFQNTHHPPPPVLQDICHPPSPSALQSTLHPSPPSLQGTGPSPAPVIQATCLPPSATPPSRPKNGYTLNSLATSMDHPVTARPPTQPCFGQPSIMSPTGLNDLQRTARQWLGNGVGEASSTFLNGDSSSCSDTMDLDCDHSDGHLRNGITEPINGFHSGKTVHPSLRHNSLHTDQKLSLQSCLTPRYTCDVTESLTSHQDGPRRKKMCIRTPEH